MKSFSRLRPVTLLPLAALLAAAPSTLACSDCGCSLSSDWAALGFDIRAGFAAGLRYEYADQTELRAGTDRVDHATITYPTTEEIQQRTLNRTTWLDVSYAVNATWAFSLSAPYINRYHTTVAEGDTDVSMSRASGLGDIRLLARYQSYSRTQNLGFQFGLKLPTGRFDQAFADGPQAGEPLDRGLQLGTGTTDLLVGVTWFSQPTETVGAFLSATGTQPLAARDDFLPSSIAIFSGGVRWLNSSRVTPQLQLNVKFAGREHGSAADTENSGGKFAYLSPGFTASFNPRTTAYAFVQLPVYQRVNGLQLQPKWIVSLGLSRYF